MLQSESSSNNSGMTQENLPTESEPLFQLQGTQRHLRAEGCNRTLPSGPVNTLGKRTANFFNEVAETSLPLVGMLPFDPDQGDALYQPERVCHVPQQSVNRPTNNSIRVIAEEPSSRAWARDVAHCVHEMRRHNGADAGMRKVVLARTLLAHAQTPIDVNRLAQRLGGDPDVTSYIAPVPTSADEAPACLVGATPELLISRRGDTIVSNPLAGSIARNTNTERDRSAAETLLASDKDRDEHRYVVEAIIDTLDPFCSELHVPEQPSLQATQTMWHLGTRIEGRLKDPNTSAAHLAGLLHPTPAVCGTPRRQALDAIRRLEPIERGFYAGAVGWTDAAGDGDWHVAIRCARIQDRAMRLYAGAGILADSQPEQEIRETDAKFKAMLDALGIDESHDALAGENS